MPAAFTWYTPDVTTLAAASTPDTDGTLTIVEGWRQGRGAYGGLTVAAAIRAIERRVADPKRLVRSVTAEIPAPTVIGSASIDVEILRSGNSVTVARATLRQDGQVTTHAVAVLAASRAGDAPTWRELVKPDAPDWQSMTPVPALPTGPEFAASFEYRVASGIPFTGGDAVTIGWVRPRDPGDARDAAYIAAVIDAWWPALMVRTQAPRPLATIAFTLDIVDGVDGLDPHAPLLYRGTVPVSGDGYFLETRELWGSDGRLVALNHQTFAIIR